MDARDILRIGQLFHSLIKASLGFKRLNDAMSSHALQQSPDFTRILSTIGVATGSCRVGGHDVQYIDRGPIRYFARPQPRANLQHLRGRHLCLVNAEQRLPRSRFGFVQLLTGGSIARLSIDQPFAPHQKWRNALHKALAQDTMTTHRKLTSMDAWLFDADLAQQRTKSFRALPHVISQNWPSKNTLISTAWDGTTPIAAMLFLIHGRVATYQIGWSAPQGRMCNAHQLLLAEAVEQLPKHGVISIDLGAVDTENARGLARFKIGTGADIVRLGGTWIAPPAFKC